MDTFKKTEYNPIYKALTEVFQLPEFRIPQF